MYVKGVDKLIFKDFNTVFLEQLIIKYPGKKIAIKIKDDINLCKEKLGLKVLNNLNINYWLIRGWGEAESKYKISELLKKRKKLKYSTFNYKYWVNRGLSEEEAKNKISDIQRKNNKKFNNKRTKNREKL
jgi:hypothetical protein